MQGSPDRPGAADNAKWRSAQTEEARLSAVDIACRTAMHDRGLVLLKPELDEFEQEHASEIAEMQRGWQEIAAEAERLATS